MVPSVFFFGLDPLSLIAGGIGRPLILPAPRVAFTVTGSALKGGEAIGAAAGSALDDPWIGTREIAIPFTLDFSPWMKDGESLEASTLSILVRTGDYLGAPDVTASLVVGWYVSGGLVRFLLGNANAQPFTSYYVTISCGTTSARTLQSDVPPIACTSTAVA
jgi:hypothetical protein